MIPLRNQTTAPGQTQGLPHPQTYCGPPLMLYGFLLAALGMGLFTLGIVWTSIALMVEPASARPLSGPILYYCGLLVIAGIIFTFIDLVFQLPKKRMYHRV